MLRVVGAALAFAALISCGQEGEASQLLLQISSDLAPGSEIHMVRVETLHRDRDESASHRLLSLSQGCVPDASGLYRLGSLGVARGLSDVARLRVVAYRDNAGVMEPVVEQRLDASFREGSLRVDVLLSKVCRDAPPCDPARSCEPTTGVCAEVRRIDLDAMEAAPVDADCIELRDIPPPTTALYPARAASTSGGDGGVSGSSGASACASGDQRCPPGCDWRLDSDCRGKFGDACEQAASCTEGAHCVHGVCCDKPCADACERCDLPGQLGTCSPLRYGAQPAPRNQPDFLTECAVDHVKVRCGGGECESSCMQGFASCNGNFQQAGCETPLGTPTNCAKCGESCRYGYCGPKGCEADVSTYWVTDSWPMEPGYIFARRYTRDSANTTLRALGALVLAESPGTRMRLAVYELNQTGLPTRLITQTEDLLIKDEEKSTVSPEPGVVRVESLLPNPVELPLDKFYAIAIQVQTPTRVLGLSGTNLTYYVASQEYGPFPSYFPLPPMTKPLLFWSMYAVTTAD